MNRFLLVIATILWTAGHGPVFVSAQVPEPAAQPEAVRAQPLPPVWTPGELGFRSFQSIRTNIEVSDQPLPTDYSQQIFQTSEADAPLAVPVTEFYWEAPEIWYEPLYFDDVQLERYGQTPCPRLQPVLSGAHFFGSLALLPYKMGVDPPLSGVTNLGYYRPGSPTPCVGRRLPKELDAALIQAGTVTGLWFALP